ncbi:amino acid racemase [Caproiciproducens sp. NJN-50]|uniref:aspartate/glutamate racemase family protein n=1 Tax=Caproiciproducens sp. NJN-50 TaxID=2507162 RepID=UPI000FFE11AD|nr:amino acid racemase [Caproiciproducens sp. NJN-50]QAT50057.1 amino acid racemase [Caproiciproducens sp. NJN-50]
MEGKTIGVLGGMGPLATADLFRKIILMTQADSDNDHIRVIIDSNVNIPDRTEAILHHGKDPLPEMMKSAKLLEAAGADVIIMPCNTAHYFIRSLERSVTVPFLNMISLTANELRENQIKTAGLLATDGTCKSGLYEKALTAAGIRTLTPEPGGQERVMQAIYRVKAGKEVPASELWPVVEKLEAGGAEGIILGCTELPLILKPAQMRIPCFDPTAVLAKQAVLFAGKQISEKAALFFCRKRRENQVG